MRERALCSIVGGGITRVTNMLVDEPVRYGSLAPACVTFTFTTRSLCPRCIRTDVIECPRCGRFTTCGSVIGRVNELDAMAIRVQDLAPGS